MSALGLGILSFPFGGKNLFHLGTAANIINYCDCFQLRSTFEKIVGQYCVCGASRLKINFFFSFRLGLDILKIR